jgi:hypothetical protein
MASFIVAGPTTDDDDAARLAAHRKAYQAAEKIRLAEEDLQQRVETRVNAYVDEGPPVSLASVESALSPARNQLVLHLEWLTLARRQARAAQARLATITDTLTRHQAARRELDTVEEEIALAHQRWVRFGSELSPPDARVAERELLHTELVQTETQAALVDVARFEDTVAVATVQELEGMLPRLQGLVLVEAAGPLADRVQFLVDQLREAYGSILACAQVAEPAGVLRRSTKLALPSIAVGDPDMGFAIAAGDGDPDALAFWRRALTAVEADPHAAIDLPGATTAALRRPSRLRRLLGVEFNE